MYMNITPLAFDKMNRKPCMKQIESVSLLQIMQHFLDFIYYLLWNFASKDYTQGEPYITLIQLQIIN